MKLSPQGSIWPPVIVPGLFVGALLLLHVFSGSWIAPQFFSIGSLTIHYYGITMALAVGAAWWLASKRALQYGLAQEQVDTVSVWLVFGGLVGARLYHVLSSWQYYWQYPLESIKIWHGGLSIFGALIGGFIVLLVFVSRKAQRSGSVVEASGAPTQHYSFNILHLLDWLAPTVLLGQIIGRFGNFFNYEAFGYPTNLPWKMFVPEYFRPSNFLSASYFHPLFLYEALGNAVILLGLLYFFRPARRVKSSWRMPAGALFFSYLLLYNVLRYAIEHLRIDSTFLVDSIRLNALVSGALVIIGAAGLYWLHRQAKAASIIDGTH